METLVKIEVRETALPANWHTAAECRAKADSWENMEVKSCVEKVLANLWEEAGKGATSSSQRILTGRPEHFYEVLQEIMEYLGYKVKAPAEPWSTVHSAKFWYFYW